MYNFDSIVYVICGVSVMFVCDNASLRNYDRNGVLVFFVVVGGANSNERCAGCLMVVI